MLLDLVPTDVIGYLGVAVGSCIMIPQVIKSYKTKKVGDVSTLTIVFFVLNAIVWLWYSARISAIPGVIANAAGLVVSITQLVLKAKYGGQ